jgi:alkanesulfonate monooxygenase SsuD/methylene tetrahydromethanopterin reductase-like flavin-dependent oxidoreductase (luciferase family)
MSDGRLIIGIGAGHLKAEFRILEQPYEERHDRTDAGIVAMRAAWSGEPIEGHLMLPPPQQRPSPPIWIGGNSPRAIRRAVELGDGWAPMPNPARYALGARSPALESADDLAGLLSIARRHAREIGRTGPFDVATMPLGITLSPATENDVHRGVAHVRELARAGATYLVLPVTAPTRSEYLAELLRLGDTLLPLIATIGEGTPLG